MKEMKSILLPLILGVLIVGGCAKNGELVRTCGTSLRDDVFSELVTPSPVPRGYTDLLVVSSLKTHRPGYHQSDGKAHGTDGYRLLINIDGQAVLISGSLGKEDIEPRRLGDPEAGDGVRYQFRKNLRLKAGVHRIVVAIPEDDVVEEREITLTGEGCNRLVLEPIYGDKKSGGRMAQRTDKHFSEGVRGFRLILNDKTL